MLESTHFADQSAGLRHLASSHLVRLGGLVAQGDQATELPLLLRLCDTLGASGHRVMVLDATRGETDAEPGLAGLLDGSFEPLDLHRATDWPGGLVVLPAMRGIASFCMNGGAAPTPHKLARACRGHDIALVYASARVFTSMASRCRVVPVLACAPHREGVLRAYSTLQLLVAAGIVPPVASVVTRSGMATAAGALAARENLRQCALDRLGCELDVLRVRATGDHGAADAETNRLALRLVEGAACLPEIDGSPEPMPAYAMEVAMQAKSAATPDRDAAPHFHRSH